jgi:hypothetical protein
MDTVVSGDYHQTGEEDWAREPVTLGEAVVRHVVEDKLPQDVRADLNRRVVEIRTELIREALAPIVTEAITAEIQQTNSYGEPTGKTSTLRELIIAEVQRVITAKDGYRDGQTFIQKLVRAEVESAISKEMSAAMKVEKDKAVAAVRAKGAEIIAEVVTEGLRRF